jgi:uncharacterized protein (TIGR03435 family)
MFDLIGIAYGAEDDSVIGGPAWLNTDRFDVIAKAPAQSSFDVLEPMVKTLLAERFKLVVREENRDMPVFILTVGKKGLKLQPAADKEGKPHNERGEGDPNLNNHVKCLSYTMVDLGEYLAQGARNFVTHPVVDETHLKGAYDFQLDWMGIGVYRQAKANPDGPPAVGALDAVEKLGLHLEEGKRPRPVVVVESVNETPTPNAEGVTAKIPTFPKEFEVAEVRPAKPFTPPAGRAGAAVALSSVGSFMVQNGRVEIMSATLHGLIETSFNLDPKFLTGGPTWLDKDRFDVIAKTAPGVPWEVLQGMLKAVIIERFSLKTHTEDQPMPVYVLKAGKKPNLKPSDGTARSDCKVVQAERRWYVCENTTMAQFAERLPGVAAAYIHPPLLDLTEIKGAYDFRVYWTPKGALQKPKEGDAAQASTPVDEATVFEAIDKQLGLKLVEERHAVPVTVVDSAQRTPSEK